MNLEVRPVSDKDVPALVDLTLQAFVPIFETLPKILGDSIYQRIWPDWRAGQRDAVETMCGDREKYTVLVANLDGRAVGFVAHALDDESKTGEIQFIAVHPEHQNCGIATELCNAALAQMKERGMTFARVETGGDPSHAPARRAYEKAGFTGLPLVRYFKSLED